MMVILAMECCGKLIIMTLQNIAEYQFIIDYSSYIYMSWNFDFVLFMLRGNQEVIRTSLSEERLWWTDAKSAQAPQKDGQ